MQRVNAAELRHGEELRVGVIALFNQVVIES